MSRPQFVFCGGMLRSGSTLQYNMVSELIERVGVGKREAWVDDHSSYFADSRKQDGMISFKSHALTSDIKCILEKGEGFALSCYRDVRDVVASWQAKTGRVQSCDEALALAGGAIAQFSEWEHLDSSCVLISKYENFAFCIDAELKKIADFLSLSADPFVLAEASAVLEVPCVRRRLSSLEDSDLTKSGPFAWDSKTLIHLDHLNGGGIGRAKDELSPELFSALTESFSGWLLSHGYSL